ncbi:MAG: ABC transporter permease [Firmicutes bacterium]|nr:ABC transporter permease [Bacillota bacterium]MBR6684465.1 ABC transporter permease [Bacillota bacterium]
MGVFIGGRVLQFVLILLAASVLIFAMSHISQIDPVAVILGGKQTSAETIAALREKFHLNDSLPQQYITWITGMLRGDFGLDFKYQQPVWDLIVGRLPVTLSLTVFSSVLAMIIAIPLGVYSGVKSNTGLDRGASLFSLLTMACPPFFISVLAIYIVSNVAPGISFTGTFHTIGQMIDRLWLPCLCLALGMIALAQRIIRSSMIDEMKSPHIQMAQAKGLPQKTVVWKHAFKNALVPLITVCGIQIGSMLVGSVLVESVFSLAGLGGLLVSAVQTSNYPVTQAITMLMVFIFLLISTVTDILYAVIDPRIRTGKGGRNE